MATAESGKSKWEAKMANAGEKWKAGVAGGASRWAAGLEAAGFSVGPRTRSAYEAGISRVGAAEFQAAVSGKGQKWLENTRRGLAQ